MVKAVVPNPRRELQAGMFIEVRLATAVRPQAVVIAEDAVLPLQGSSFVWVVQRGKATRRQVELGVRTPGLVEVRSGVESGEQVVVGGQERLAEGAPVAAQGDRSDPRGAHPRWMPPRPAARIPRARRVHAGARNRPAPIHARRTPAAAGLPSRLRGAERRALLLPAGRHARLHQGGLRVPRRLGRPRRPRRRWCSASRPTTRRRTGRSPPSTACRSRCCRTPTGRSCGPTAPTARRRCTAGR